MDNEKVKQVVIAYHAIENACDAMQKPAEIELGDSETVAKMPTGTYDTLTWIKSDCEAIQRVLERMADYISDLEESVYNDGEIKKSGKRIRDILFDIQPVLNKIPGQPALDEIADSSPPEKTNLVEFAGNLVEDIRKAQTQVGEGMVVKNLKGLGF